MNNQNKIPIAGLIVFDGWVSYNACLPYVFIQQFTQMVMVKIDL